MDEIAKVMARGLITLPSSVRKKVGLKEGDLVKVEVKGDAIVIRKEKRIYDLKGSIAGGPQKSTSFADIFAEELKKKSGG